MSISNLYISVRWDENLAGGIAGAKQMGILGLQAKACATTKCAGFPTGFQIFLIFVGSRALHFLSRKSGKIILIKRI
jgi:hypothetical protein